MKKKIMTYKKLEQSKLYNHEILRLDLLEQTTGLMYFVDCQYIR